MSRHKPNRAETVQLTLRCNYCRASPGKWCTTFKLRFSRDLHAARFNEATAIGLLPIKDTATRE